MTKVYQDLRGFLETLEEENQLVRIKDEVMPEPDIASAGRASSRLPNGPAILFEKINGYKGQVATMVHGSWANHALMMGMDKNTPIVEQFHELNNRWNKFPVESKILSREESKCKENVVEGDDINLFELMPLYRINEQDGGFYISKASVVSADPDAPQDLGKQNVGTYRIQVKGKRKVAGQFLAMHDLAKQFEAA